MATNPLPDGSTNLTVNITKDLRKEIQRLADASGITVSAYVRALLRIAVDEQLTSALITERPPQLGYAAEQHGATQARRRKSDSK